MRNHIQMCQCGTAALGRQLHSVDCTSGCTVGNFIVVESPQDASDIFPTKIVLTNAKTKTDSIENYYSKEHNISI